MRHAWRALALAAAVVAIGVGRGTAEEAAASGPDAPLLDALGDASETIVLGTCTRAAARWDAAAGLVVTDVTIAVHDVVKGRSAPTLTLTEPGGTLPERNLGMLVPHAPRFAVGEEALLFLQRDGAGRLRVVGGERGRRRLTREPSSDAARVDGRPWPDVRERLERRAAGPGGR